MDPPIGTKILAITSYIRSSLFNSSFFDSLYVANNYWHSKTFFGNQWPRLPPKIFECMKCAVAQLVLSSIRGALRVSVEQVFVPIFVSTKGSVAFHGHEVPQSEADSKKVWPICTHAVPFNALFWIQEKFILAISNSARLPTIFDCKKKAVVQFGLSIKVRCGSFWRSYMLQYLFQRKVLLLLMATHFCKMKHNSKTFFVDMHTNCCNTLFNVTMSAIYFSKSIVLSTSLLLSTVPGFLLFFVKYSSKCRVCMHFTEVTFSVLHSTVYDSLIRSSISSCTASANFAFFNLSPYLFHSHLFQNWTLLLDHNVKVDMKHFILLTLQIITNLIVFDSMRIRLKIKIKDECFWTACNLLWLNPLESDKVPMHPVKIPFHILRSQTTISHKSAYQIHFQFLIHQNFIALHKAHLRKIFIETAAALQVFLSCPMLNSALCFLALR